MGLLSGNSCNIITLFPLGLQCSSINASTPQSSNGVVTLYITGGTPPYNVTWNTGAQGTLLTSLTPGEYTATVVDYYGDFTGTTTCTVDYDSFYLEEFEDCSNPTKYVYYLANLVNPQFSASSVYELTTQVGCWTNSGTTLYTGQTYINSFADILSGPYSGCSECLPPTPPTPTYPSQLCFQQTQGTTLTQVDFSSGSTINGYPSWTSITPSYLMYYNTGSTRWEVSGYTNGTVYRISPSTPPTGSWVITGPNAFNTSINVVTGACGNPPLTLTVNANNPLCSTQDNGSVTIVGNGGVPSYTYSLNGVTYQNSSTFLNLNSGTYTAYIKDSLGTIATQTFTLTSQQNFQNYNVNLVLTQGNTVSVGNSFTKTSTWSISVSPSPLPAGVTVNMNLLFNIGWTGYTATPTIGPTITNSITTNSNPNTTVSLVSSGNTTGTTILRPGCEGAFINTSARTTTYSVQLSTNGLASGTVVQYINTPCGEINGCPNSGVLKDTLSLQNITISPNQCRSISSNVAPQTTTLTKTGIICERE
jgi:hypothetical protein